MYTHAKIISVMICLGFSAQVFAAENIDTTATIASQPVVFAPSGLKENEQADLERSYRFSYRGKDKIIQPYAGGQGVGSPEYETLMTARTEEERYYRYFRAAAKFREEEKFEEAEEIIKFLIDRKPDDEYLQKYLEEIRTEKDKFVQGWKVKTEVDGKLLRKKEIENLLDEGYDYYLQKKYDKALLKFSSVLSMEPDNYKANKYFDLLKKYYLQEVRVDTLVSDIENPNHDKNVSGVVVEKENVVLKQALDKNGINKVAAVDEILNKNEANIEKTAATILNEQEIGLTLLDARLSDFLDKAELGITVEDVISRSLEEERKLYLLTLGSGDIIQISVRDHPELSGRAVVRLDGEVVLPLVNDSVKVAKLTVQEATTKISAIMKRYVKDPVVTIAIDSYRSKVFYVIDENGCTPYPITRANLTVRDALFLSDWGNNRALGRVLVVKPNKLHPIIKKVNAFNIIYRGSLVDNIRIDDGDVIYVPLTVAAKVTQTIDDSLAPFRAVRSLRTEWLNQRWNQEGYYDLPRIPRNAAQQNKLNSGAGGIQAF